MDPFSASGTDTSAFLTGIACFAVLTHLAALIGLAGSFRAPSRDRLVAMLRLVGVSTLLALAMPFAGFLFTRETTGRDASFDPTPIARAKYLHGMAQAWTQLEWGLLALAIPVLVTAYLWWRVRRFDAGRPTAAAPPADAT